MEKGYATHSSILGLPLWLNGKESARNAGDLGLIPRLGRSPGEGKGYPLQYLAREFHGLYGVAKNQTRLSDFRFYSALQINIFIQVYGSLQELPVGSNSGQAVLARTMPLNWQRVWSLASLVFVNPYGQERLTRHCWNQNRALLV